MDTYKRPANLSIAGYTGLDVITRSSVLMSEWLYCTATQAAHYQMSSAESLIAHAVVL